MFEISFYNESGRIVFGGGNSESRFKIIEAEGLGFSGKRFTTVSYANAIGEETVSEKARPRTVTLKGDIFIDEGFDTEYRDAIKTLNRRGTLEITTAKGKRCIDARCIEFVEGVRQGKYLPFTVQFVCDNPYFKSESKIETPLFKVIPNLDEDFTFPGSFSTRISRRNIVLSSSAETEPTFVIEVGEDAGESIEIINHTSGERIKINYEPLANECITVDMENRRIYNQDGENLLYCLADDSFFDGFHLYPGENDCEVCLDSQAIELNVYIIYNEMFLEAVG